MFKTCTNKSLPAIVHVRVRRGVVQVPVRKPCIRPVVPVTSEVGKHALHTPIGGLASPKPPKEVF